MKARNRKYVISTEWDQTLVGKYPHLYLTHKENGNDYIIDDVEKPSQWTKYPWEYLDYDEALTAFEKLTNTNQRAEY